MIVEPFRTQRDEERCFEPASSQPSESVPLRTSRPNLAVDVVAECADAFRSSYWTIRGAPKAITAMAHKLARLVYRMLKWGHEYVDKGLQYYEDRHREQQVQLLKKRAVKLGLQIVEPQPT